MLYDTLADSQNAALARRSHGDFTVCLLNRFMNEDRLKVKLFYFVKCLYTDTPERRRD